ncbi:MAG: ferritin-like domain-containing protein [Planctomycetota bacterium]
MVARPKFPFEKFFSICERHRWKMDTDVDWDSIQRDLVSPLELETLHQAALVEGFSPTYAADLLDLYCDDPEMGSFLSIQFYEEYKHFHALRRYLRLNGIEISDEEAVRGHENRTKYTQKLIPVIKFGVSEIFTAIFYRNISASTNEPVLKQLAHFISQDEYRHLGFYLSYLDWLVKTEGITVDEVNHALARYQHQGLDAIDTWVDFWNNNGRRYTGVEPYLVLQSNLNRIVGKGTRLRRLARQTSRREMAAKFQ